MISTTEETNDSEENKGKKLDIRLNFGIILLEVAFNNW